MEDMGCGFNWVFTEDELRNTPSVRSGISISQEQTFRMKQAMLIQTIGSKSRLTQLAMNTSVIFMHRFFMYRSVKQFPRLHLAIGFAFAGGKVEESFCKLEHLVRTAVDVIRSNKNREFLDKSDPLTYEMDCQWRGKMEALLHSNCSTDSPAYQDMRKIILECEAEIYAVIGFNLSIVHPHNFVVRMCGLLGAENIKDISHYAYNLATASSQLTMLCLKYKPEMIAIMCLNVASKAHNVDLMSLKDKKVKWFQAFDSTIELADVEAVSREFLSLAKGYPFWKDANGQQVFLNRRAMPGQARGQSVSTPPGSRQQHPSNVAHGTPQSSAATSSLASTSQSYPASSGSVNIVPSHQAVRSSSSHPTQALHPQQHPHQQTSLPSHSHQQSVAPALTSSVSAPHIGSYRQGGNGLRQNPAATAAPADFGNGRNGTVPPVEGVPRDQPQVSRSHQRSSSSQQQQAHLHQQSHQQQQLLPQHYTSHHHHHHQHHQPHQQQQRPVAPTTLTTTSRSSLPSSQPQDARSLSRQQTQVLTATTHPSVSRSHQPPTLPLSTSASVPHLPSISSSSRDLLSSSSQHLAPVDASKQTTQRQPRSQSEQGRQQRPLTSHPPNPQDLARSQSTAQRPRSEAASSRPIEASLDSNRHRIQGPAQPSQHQHQNLQQRTQGADIAQQQQLQQQQQQQHQRLAGRQSQMVSLEQQQRQGRQQPSHPQQIQPGQHPQQDQQHPRRPIQQANVELSPHTPPLPYPGTSVDHPLALPVATAANTLPGSGDAQHVAGLGLSRQHQQQQLPRNGGHGLNTHIQQASDVTAVNTGCTTGAKLPVPAAHQEQYSGTNLQEQNLTADAKPAELKLEGSTSSPADEKMLLGGAVSNFMKPQDSPSNPRIKIKVKRDRDAASGERHHSVKYAESGLKIKIKPPKPAEGDTDSVGANISGQSSRSSTPREDGELEGTPSPASSTSSGRRSEGLRIRLSVPKLGDGSKSKRDGGEQMLNGLTTDQRESSSVSSGHRSHHHSHHHGRHHKSKKHSKHSRHESSKSSKRSASGEPNEDRPAKSSRSETFSSSSSNSHSLSLAPGGYPGLSSASSNSSSLGFSTADLSFPSQQGGGFSITDAFSNTMPSDIFDDDDEDTLPSIPLTPVDALPPQVPSHHERFQQMMNQHRARVEASRGAQEPSANLHHQS